MRYSCTGCTGDLRGRDIDPDSRNQIREYRACTIEYGVRGWVSIDYKNGHVQDKAAFW
jgi:hypothetical protein